MGVEKIISQSPEAKEGEAPEPFWMAGLDSRSTRPDPRGGETLRSFSSSSVQKVDQNESNFVQNNFVSRSSSKKKKITTPSPKGKPFMKCVMPGGVRKKRGKKNQRKKKKKKKQKKEMEKAEKIKKALKKAKIWYKNFGSLKSQEQKDKFMIELRYLRLTNCQILVVVETLTEDLNCLKIDGFELVHAEFKKYAPTEEKYQRGGVAIFMRENLRTEFTREMKVLIQYGLK